MIEGAAEARSAPPRETDLEGVHRMASDAMTRWSARVRREVLAHDRVWLAFGCGACGATRDAVLEHGASPWLGEGGAPLYRTREELEALVGAALRGRPAFVAADDWEALSACPCRAPRHHRRVLGAALLHARPGEGAGLALLALEGRAPAWLRVPDGGVPAPTEPGIVTLLDAWAALPDPAEDRAVGRELEAGVWLFAATDPARLALAMASTLGTLPRQVALLDATVSRALGRDAARALAVSTDALFARLRAWARSALDADVLRSERGPVLATAEGDWPLRLDRVVRAMAEHGRTPGEAMAAELDRARRALADRLETLRALTERMPGASFELEGTRAVARRPDGRAGLSVELADLPEGAATLDPALVAREAAFLFDAAPEWADRLRTCPCGAPASLARRLVGGSPDDARAPWILRWFGPSDAPTAAEVLALACDRHVRVLPEAELRALGLEDATIARRLLAERPELNGLRPRRVGPFVLIEGPWASSVLLAEAELHALVMALEPAERRWIGWGIGTDHLILATADHDGAPGRLDELDDAVRATARALGLAPTAFWVRCLVEPRPEGGG